MLQAVKTALGGGVILPGDTVRPSVSFVVPVNGATISGTVNLSANASDNVGVAGVQFSVDGNNLGSDDTVPPFEISWNSTTAANGARVLTATARDVAGNRATATVNVFVSNTTPPPSSGLPVYQDALAATWINVSWNASVNFASTEQVHSGSYATKIIENAWGALSLHSGEWGATVDVNPALYTGVEFAIYPASPGVLMYVMCENDLGESFPNIPCGALPANQWTVVSIPMSQLDPASRTIHRLNISDQSGTTTTFFVDDVRFVGSAPATSVPLPPALSVPANFATKVSTTPTFRWTASAGATSYRIQISSRSDFASTQVDQAGLTATSFTAPRLPAKRTLYWRANAANTGGTSGWSQTWQFRTGSIAVAASQTLASSVEQLSDEVPNDYVLGQNFPNPFNPSTSIDFSVPEAGDITLSIYNVLGEEIATLFHGNVPAGTYSALWNPSGLPSGVYFYRLYSGSFSETRKLMLAK